MKGQARTMNEWAKSLMAGTVAWLAGNVHGSVLDLVRLRVAIWYLQTVRTARGLFLLILAATLGSVLAGAGFVLLHIGLYLLLPAPANAIVLMGLGLTYIVAGICLVSMCSAEKRWMKASGANAACAALTGRRPEG